MLWILLSSSIAVAKFRETQYFLMGKKLWLIINLSKMYTFTANRSQDGVAI